MTITTVRLARAAPANQSYPASMSTSPVSPEDIRAAAEVHEELGPEYQHEVVAAFVDKVEREVAARVAVRLAAASRPVARRGSPGTLLKGMAIGACAGVLMTIAATSAGHAREARPLNQGQVPPGPIQELPYFYLLRPQVNVPILKPKPIPAAPAKKF